MATYEDSSMQHFVRVSDIAKEPQKMLMPICGYEDMPLVSLEEAVTPLVSILPRIRDYVYVAKQRCEPVPADGLARDESASIMLYTMQWEPEEKCLHFALNSTLRSEDRRKLKPWFLYLKLILTALFQLPSTRHFVYRGVKMDLSEQHPRGIPGDSIQAVDPTGNDRIPYRIAPKSCEFRIKTDRIRPEFHRIPNYRIPVQITPEKVRSVPVEFDHRILS